jgi:hypothetical protein
VKTIVTMVATASAIVLVAGMSWFGVKEYRCKQRNAALSRRVKLVEQDAHEQLKVGTSRKDVARFYKEHGIPFRVVHIIDTNEAIGTLYTTGGCAPLGCGTDKYNNWRTRKG